MKVEAMLARRNTTSVLIGLTLFLGVLLAWSASSAGAMASPVGIVEIGLPDDVTHASVRLARRDDNAVTWTRIEDRLLTVSNAKLELAPGEYEITVVESEHEFLKLRRQVIADEHRRDEIALVHLDSVRKGMREIPAGEIHCTLLHSSREHQVETRVVRMQYERFLIDKSPVTIGSYRIYLKAIGRDMPLSWPERCRDLWNNPPREDWEDLPMTYVTWHEARDYAEWCGKRLPLRVEWLAALGMDEPDWLTNLLASEDTMPFNLARDKTMLSTTTPEGFERYAIPVGSSALQGPYGLDQAIGNTTDWLADAVLVEDMRILESHYCLGGAWILDLSMVFDKNGFSPSFSPNKAFHVGFRCAKSLAPHPLPYVVPEERD